MIDQITSIIIGIGLFGVGISVILIIVNIKRSQYEAEARNCILAEIKTETGWPKRVVVKPHPDGWVTVGDGDYMLPRVKGEGENELVTELVGVKQGVTATEARMMRNVGDDGQKPRVAVKTVITEWDKYPSVPWLGLRWTQVPIRKQCWWENDPEPIVRKKYRAEVTALDARAHTREMAAMELGVQIKEMEARQKQFMEMLLNQPNKTVVYILLGANILVSIIGVLAATGRLG